MASALTIVIITITCINIMLYLAGYTPANNLGIVADTNVISTFVTTDADGNPISANEGTAASLNPATGNWSTSSSGTGSQGFNFIDSLKIFGGFLVNIIGFPFTIITLGVAMVQQGMPLAFFWIFFAPIDVIYLIGVWNMLRGSST
jgi:hypothetical protein